jgi:3D (Asp-Asp-Asp) domain-containing protein
VVTAYCPCRRCCGRFANGRTSTDTSAWQPGAATDPDVIPYGSTVAVPGYGTVRVDDTGLAMRRSWRSAHRIHIDVRFDYHWQARRWGSQLLEVEVTPPAR